ncbi:MAG TPA: hypothetical protein VEL07_23320 [Planctomycetota bacterium]|nr:hypothetical protein [Planctomycetota bacterium]
MVVRSMLLIALSLVGLAAAEDAAEPAAAEQPAEQPVAENAAPAPAPAPAAAPEPDPTAALVAQGRFVYRTRDIDALALIAARHAKRKLTRAEEEQLRQALGQLVVAREPLMQALAYLPALPGPARDQLLLDLIDYQAEPAGPPAAAGEPAANAPAAQPDGGAASAGPATTTAGGEVMVRLPPLSMTRALDQIGRRQLTVGLALYFPDPSLAQKLEAKAPLIQDAVLGHLNQLPPGEFAQPNHEELKLGLAAAISARVPEFPHDSVLITQLDVEDPAAAAAPAPAAEGE